MLKEPSDTEKSQVAFWVNLDAGGVYALDNVDTRVASLPCDCQRVNWRGRVSAQALHR